MGDLFKKKNFKSLLHPRLLIYSKMNVGRAKMEEVQEFMLTIITHIRDDLTIFEEGQFETIFIETTFSQNNSVIGEMYRVPNTNEQRSIGYFENIFTKLHSTNRNVIIGCDQNFDYLKINSHTATSDLLNQAFSAGLLPVITKPTRVTHATATLIDNIYVKLNTHVRLTSGILLHDISDHLPVCVNIELSCKQTVKTPLTFKHRKLDETAVTAICENLAQINWNCLDNMEQENAFTYFTSTLQEVMDMFAPEKITTIPKRKIIREPWVTKGMIVSSMRLDKLYKVKLNKPPEHGAHEEYRKYRNLFNKIKRIGKEAYYTEYLNKFRVDIKSTWKAIYINI